MSKDLELNNLKERQQTLFKQKQAAFQKFKDLQKQTTAAYEIMQSAWDERVCARERMNSEFEARQSAYLHRDLIWNEYNRIRDQNNSKIKLLKNEADAEHRAMQNCFEQASNAYLYGDRSEAPYHSQAGYEHKRHRDNLNAEISKLAHQIKQAKANAKASAPEINSSTFNYARAAFESIKACHNRAQAEFKRLKALRDSAKAEFDRLDAQFKQAQTTFQHKLEATKSERTNQKA